MLDRTDTIHDGPDLWTGVALEIDEIAMGVNVLIAKVRDLRGCQEHRQEVSAKIIGDDIAKVSGQINSLASHFSSVVARHVNRKAVTR